MSTPIFSIRTRYRAYAALASGSSFALSVLVMSVTLTPRLRVSCSAFIPTSPGTKYGDTRRTSDFDPEMASSTLEVTVDLSPPCSALPETFSGSSAKASISP